MVRILVAECKQEVSSFNPVPSVYDDFWFQHGQGILDYHRGMPSEVAGALSVFEASPDVQLVPTYSARARSSAGTLAADSYHRIADEFLQAVRDAGPVDAVYYALHGAMAAEDEPDPEGYLLEQTREILGEDIPIVISLDLHAILTDRMLRHVNGLTAYHTYPHRDMYETGERAGRLLMRILTAGARPVIARVFIPALVRGDELITDTGLLGGFIRRAQAIEAEPWGMAAGMVIGNPFTDVPELGSCSFVITDGDRERAEREALDLASGFWQVRDRLQWPLMPLDEAIKVAAETEGTLIIKDAADAPSSGAPGDSNAILRGLIESGYTKRALLPLVDAPAARMAAEAGIGATIETTLGGTLDGRFWPLPVTARVKSLSDGRYRSEYHGAAQESGLTAVLEIGSISVVVTSRTVSLTDRSLFYGNGLDPKHFDAVIVKSPHCRYEYFREWAAGVVSVDVPGSTSNNVRTLGHTQVHRPIYPLDADLEFEPKVSIYTRG